MTTYRPDQPDRADLDASTGPLVVAFGTEWCGYCLAASRHIDPVVAAHPDVPLLGVEDGPGRQPGRSYRVKLWPTLIFLRDGVEVARVVRPGGRGEVEAAYDAITRPA